MAQGFLTQRSDRSAPGSTSRNAASGYIYGGKYTVPGSSGTVTVTELGAYCDNSGAGAGAGTFSMAIYSIDGVGDLLDYIGGASSGSDPPSSAGWVEFTGLSITVNAGQEYAICVWPDDGNLDMEGLDTTGATNSNGMEWNGSPGGTQWSDWPDLGGVSTHIDWDPAFYAVYSTGGETEESRDGSMRASGAINRQLDMKRSLQGDF